MSEVENTPVERPSESLPADVQTLLAEIRERVEHRRQNGDYPAGLEDDMEAHFRRIVSHRASPPSSTLQADVDALDSHMEFTRARFPVDSGVVGGEVIHRAMNKALARQSESILAQVQEFADAVRRAMRSLAATVQDPASHVHGDLFGHLEAVIERLESYERAPIDSEAAVLDLRRRVEQLEAELMPRQSKPWFKYEDFEARVGRDQQSLERLYAKDADALAEVGGPVLDIGCGRGEFLGLLAERGVEARGIELDPIQADEARQRGHHVVTGDGIRLLEAENDASLGAVVLLQVVEHISHSQLLDLIAGAHDKLRPGGKLIIETPNPQSLYILAHSFWLDPTHDKLVHPIYLTFLMEQAGFRDIYIDWRNPPADDMRMEAVGDGGAGDRNAERLNKLVFAAQDYCIFGTR